MKDIYNCTINDFIRCWFDGNYSALGEAATKSDYNKIREGYIDIAGLYAGRDFDMVCQLFNLDNRIKFIGNYLAAQRATVTLTGLPDLTKLDMPKKYGHNLTWVNDVSAFLKQLDIIELKEKTIQAQFEITEKQLNDFRDKKEVSNRTNAQERADFTKMLIALEIKTQADRSGIAIYDLALMVKTNREQAEQMRQEMAQNKLNRN